MITKERLEELIEQNATIYSIHSSSSFEIKLTENSKIYNTSLFGHSVFGIPFRYLFETKEEAEWHKEFGCIERTERLELPTWEELQNKREFYIGFNDREGIVRYYLAIDMPYKKDVGVILISYSDANNDTIICFDKIATKENYTLACRKVKELFLGSEDE